MVRTAVPTASLPGSRARELDCREYVAHQAFGRDAIGLCLKTENEPVSQGGQRDLVQILARHVETVLEQRANLGTADERLQTARAGAVADVLTYRGWSGRLLGVRREDQSNCVRRQVRRNYHFARDANHA